MMFRLHFNTRLMFLSSFLDNLKSIPDNLGRILSNAAAILVTVCFGIGVVLTIVGAIQWATGWNDKGGKKTIVKGIVLIGLSLLGGGIGITVVSFV